MELAANLDSVRSRIQAACGRADRAPDEILLLTVSKGHPPGTVLAAAELGLSVFGESKVQEAKGKIPLCPARLRWHMIGHLQSNKVRDAVRLFDLIESVDSLRLAEEIQNWAGRAAKTVPILLEVNVSGESSKYGFTPQQLLAQLEAVNAMPRIELHGLMTIAPWTPDPEKVRPVFRRLRELKVQCEEILGAPLAHLSMGMSGDFEVAIEEGATIIRLGTALLGRRGRTK